MNKILITGGSGFLGNHLSGLLVKNGYDVTVLDKMPSSVAGVKYVKGDFNDQELIKRLLIGIDGVFHLAAVVGVDYCNDNPDQVDKVNVNDTSVFLKLCTKLGVKRVIFTSSSEIYGNSNDIPYREESLVHPFSAYGKGKLLIENYIKTISLSQTTFGVVRPFNVYGPGQRPSFVVPIFIKAALNNLPIDVFGDGNQTRCFTYVEDVANGILKLYAYNKTPYEIVNIGNNREFSMNELASLILSLIPSSTSEITHKKYGIDGVREETLEIVRRVPSIEKAKTLLGFEAKTTLELGLDKTIEYYRQNI